MNTHTHRGHCQYCLRLIAIDVETGNLAKHGYTVDGGMFQGQCPGSEVASLHVDRTHTDRVIVMYQEKAARLTKYADDLEAGRAFPIMVAAGRPSYESAKTDEDIVRYWRFEERTVKVTKINPRTGHKREVETQETVKVLWADANAVQKRRGLICELREKRNGAETAATFAKDMTRWAAEVFGTEAYRADDLDSWAKVGDMVRAGGEKNGFDAKVEAVDVIDYKTFGFRRGGSTVKAPHVQITRPAIPDTYTKTGKVKKAGRPVHTYWEAMRNVKPAEGSLMARLKAAGLI